jgi:hypothetical protein
MFNDAHHLMARNQGRFARCKLAFDHVQIGAADAACMYAHQHLAGIEALRRGRVSINQWVGFDRSASRQHACLHGVP